MRSLTGASIAGILKRELRICCHMMAANTHIKNVFNKVYTYATVLSLNLHMD